MIIQPANWREIGQPIAVDSLEMAIRQAVTECHCDAVALSGGIDSTLLLYYLADADRHVEAFTLGVSWDHPDVVHARIAVERYGNVRHHILVPALGTLDVTKRPGDLDGDQNVRSLYSHIARYTNRVIAGDGVDEWMCGYYPHMLHPTEETYIGYLRRLYADQLEPLDRNSGEVLVCLPYLHHEVVSLMSQIPISEKVSADCRKRIVVELARRAGIPEAIIERRKYGLCDAGRIK